MLEYHLGILHRVASDAADRSEEDLGKIESYLWGRKRRLAKQAEEGKMVEELAKESVDLKEMVTRVMTGSPSKGTAVSVIKRRREDYDELEEQTLKVLRTCKKLKGTGEK